ATAKAPPGWTSRPGPESTVTPLFVATWIVGHNSGGSGQPASAACTARIASPTPMLPSPATSAAGQADRGRLPSAMLTTVTTSGTVTTPSPLQSPGQVARADPAASTTATTTHALFTSQ